MSNPWITSPTWTDFIRLEQRIAALEQALADLKSVRRDLKPQTVEPKCQLCINGVPHERYWCVDDPQYGQYWTEHRC